MRGWQVITGAADNWSPATPSDAAIQSLLPPATSTVAPLQWPPVISTGLRGGPNLRDSAVSGTGGSSSAVHHTLASASPQGTALGLTNPELAPLNLHQGVPPSLASIPEGPTLGGPGTGANRLLPQLQEARAAGTSAGGHSSGHSGGGHVDTASLAHPQADGGELPHGGEHVHAASSYRLRTRSSSLRAAWVEKPLDEFEEEAEEAVKALAPAVHAAAGRGADTDGGTDSEGEELPSPVSRKRSKPAAGKAGGKAPTRKRARGGAASKAASSSKAAAAASKAVAPAVTHAAAAEEEEFDTEDDSEDDEDDGKGGQKRLGRPVVYRGDPDAPHLTDAERRKIKRRIANRESARRVRAKRAELMDELQIKVTAQGQQNARLASHAAMLESQRNMLMQQNALLQQKMSQKAGENVSLYNQLYLLRRLLPPEVVAQAERDAHAATPPPGSPMQGSGMFVPITPNCCPGGGEDPFAGDPSALQQGLGFL